MKDELIYIQKMPEYTKLQDEFLEFFVENDNLHGWLMGLNEEELEQIGETTDKFFKNIEDIESETLKLLPFFYTLIFKNYPANNSSFTVEEWSEASRRWTSTVAIENLRRKGMVTIEIIGKDCQDWVIHKTDKLDRYIQDYLD